GILLLILVLPIASSLSNFPIVHTSYGSVRGYEYRARNGFLAEIYKPPLRLDRGDGRSLSLQRRGTTHSMERSLVRHALKGWASGFSEDCLTLNIYTSKKCRESNSSCPVVMYIHGSNALYDGTMMFPDEILVQNFASKSIYSEMLYLNEEAMSIC
ncbi:hypothetical protein PENTCL1PPCAC_2741, partial [Pristionchus entomophagus]